MKGFFRTLSRSMTDLKFFREARRRKVSDAIGYLAVLLILVWLIPFAADFFVSLRAANDALISGLRTHVPADAVFTMKDGAFTTNLEEPILIEREDFTVIVNSASSSLSLPEDGVGVAVNRDAIVQREGRDRVQVVGYSDFPDFETDRAGLDRWIAKYGPWIVLLIATAAILAYSLALSLVFGFFVTAHAFVLWLAFRIAKRPMRYARTFAVAAYAATLPIIVKAIAEWSDVDIGSAATFLYWILLGFIVYDLRKEGAHGHEDPAADGGAPEGRKGSGRQ